MEKDIHNEKRTTRTEERETAKDRALDVGTERSVKDANVSDSVSDYIFKKTEKMSTAVYLVTEFLSDSEPLKRSMRERALTALMTARPRSHVSLKDSTGTLYALEEIITELISLLELSYRAGYISEMNFEIFHKELLHLVRSVRSGRSETANARYTFPKDFFSVPEEPSWKKRGEDVIERYGKEFEKLREEILGPRQELKEGVSRFAFGREKDAPAPTSRTSNTPRTEDRFMHPSRPVLGAGNSFIKDKPTEDIAPRGNTHSSGRRQRILDLIRIKGEVGVKDISKVVSGCSEKTIQRELASLVKDDIVQKTGERRWSRYSLKEG